MAKRKQPAIWDETPREQTAMQRIPAKWKWADFITTIAEQAGSDTAVAKRLGFSDGSRISEWRRGTKRMPSAETCAKLAVLYNYNPLDVLSLGGHKELATLLQGRLPDEDAERERARDVDYEQFVKAVKQAFDDMYKRPVTGAR